MKPTYSICATHYNNIEYIEKSAGVLAETIEGLEDWELVVVDAGSDDGSLEYLKDIATSQNNVRLFIAEGSNIGRGRSLAAENARGDVLIQVPDMDAEYYSDGRIFDIVNFYERLVEKDEAVMLNVIGGYIVSKTLLEEMGGWNEIPVAEERGLGRRFLREGKLRFCDVKLFKHNYGENKGLKSSLKRFYRNSVVKMYSGASLPWLFKKWFTNTDSLKPKIGAIIVFPVAWIDAHLLRDIQLHTYDKQDEYILDFRESVRENDPEIWLDVPDDLEEYAA